ncbi:hypothetical protein COOONC_06458 [Cooperia oncophora]
MRTILTLLLATTAALAARYRKRSRFHFNDEYFNAPFMKGISNGGRLEYNAIFRFNNLTIAQEQEKVAQWAKKYSRTAEVEKFKAKMDENMKQLKQYARNIIKALPSALEEYMKATENKSKTMTEIRKDVARLNAKNPTVFKVLRYILRSNPRWRRMRRIRRRKRTLRTSRSHRHLKKRSTVLSGEATSNKTISTGPKPSLKKLPPTPQRNRFNSDELESLQRRQNENGLSHIDGTFESKPSLVMNEF